MLAIIAGGQLLAQGIDTAQAREAVRKGRGWTAPEISVMREYVVPQAHTGLEQELSSNILLFVTCCYSNSLCVL